VVIVLYAVSALFGLLSLFLLWPTGSTLGLVLAILGTGIWIGVQHLGYLEFGEIRRVAQRTIEQRNVFVNNLSIRRATEELKASGDYADVCRLLEQAFSSNDFDGFELKVTLPYRVPEYERLDTIRNTPEEKQYNWSKPGCSELLDHWSSWKMTLELVSTSNRHCGWLEIYRLYNPRPLMLDINLLTLGFPVVLADAVERAMRHASNVEAFSDPNADMELSAAEAG
jgi:hypothetical protein